MLEKQMDGALVEKADKSDLPLLCSPKEEKEVTELYDSEELLPDDVLLMNCPLLVFSSGFGSDPHPTPWQEATVARMTPGDVRELDAASISLMPGSLTWFIG